MQASSNSFLGKDWQIFSTFDLQINSEVESRIGLRLVNTLSPLDLPQSLLTRILSAAQLSTATAYQSAAVTGLSQISVKIYLSSPYPSEERTWGFFRIEKTGQEFFTKSLTRFVIEFYLYNEG